MQLITETQGTLGHPWKCTGPFSQCALYYMSPIITIQKGISPLHPKRAVSIAL